MSNQTIINSPLATDEPIELKPEIIRINKIKSSQGQLHKIQKDLEVLVDAMAKNPSIVSRVASYWGKIPLWQKIIAGLILVVPPLIIGIFIQLIVCLVIAGFLLAGYVGGGFVLHDHHRHTQHSTKNIKSGISSLAEGLDSVTRIMEQISEDLSHQVTLFNEENEKLEHNIEELKGRNNAILQEIEQLKTIISKLKIAEETLEKKCTVLRTSMKEQESVLAQTQACLDQTKLDFAKNQHELDDKNKELATVQELFKIEVNRYDNLLEVLTTAAKNLSDMLLKTPEEQEQFHHKLIQFIEDKDANFLKIFNQYTNLAEDLATLKKEYDALIETFKNNINKQTGQLDRWNKLEQPETASSLLGTYGIYASSGVTNEELTSSNPAPNTTTPPH